MVAADFGAARVGGGAAAGSPGGGAVGIVAAGVAAGAAVSAFRRESIRRGRCGARPGAGDLVGAAGGLAGKDSRNDGATAAGVFLVCGAAELCGDAVRGSARKLKGWERRTARSGGPTWNQGRGKEISHRVHRGRTQRTQRRIGKIAQDSQGWLSYFFRLWRRWRTPGRAGSSARIGGSRRWRRICAWR